MSTPRRLRITEEDVALWDASEKPELPARYEAAIPSLVERSGLEAEWWRSAMHTGWLFWIGLVDGGLEVDADSLRDLGTGVVSNLVAAHLGRPVPADLSAEFDRRLADLDGDDGRRQAWSAIRHVVVGPQPDPPG
jgi:hypothetical protein